MIIEKLFIYPIKGCAGISLTQATLDEYGLQNDRRYQLVDANNRFISQRNSPHLCFIHTSISDRILSVHYPGIQDLQILNTTSVQKRKVVIWEDEVLADDMGEEAAEWFSSILGEKARLVRIGSGYDRKVRVGDSIYSSQVHFGDSQPILIISLESLDDLNSKLHIPVDIDRFRPNIVISGAQAYGEDHFSDITTDTVHLQFTKRCARCSVITIDQKTGISGPEPLRTLATFRKQGPKVYFGAYYIAQKKGTLKIGEQIQVR